MARPTTSKLKPNHLTAVFTRSAPLFYVYEILARYYRSIGDRKKAVIYAKKSMEFGEKKPVFDSIFKESQMSFLRYLIRRMIKSLF